MADGSQITIAESFDEEGVWFELDEETNEQGKMIDPYSYEYGDGAWERR